LLPCPAQQAEEDLAGLVDALEERLSRRDARHSVAHPRHLVASAAKPTRVALSSNSTFGSIHEKLLAACSM
jgi:hypothetical protein